MVEKVFVIYERDEENNRANGEIIAFFIVNDIDLGYLDKKVVAYCDKEIETLISTVLDDFKIGKVNIRGLQEKLNTALKNSDIWKNYTCSFEFPLMSGIVTEKTMRNKRMLKAIGKEKFVRVSKNVGIA